MGFQAWLSSAQTEWNEAFLAISKSALAPIKIRPQTAEEMWNRQTDGQTEKLKL